MLNVVRGNPQKIEEAVFSLVEPALQVYGRNRESFIEEAIENTKFYDMGEESASTAINTILGLQGIYQKKLPHENNIESYFLVDTTSTKLDKYVLYRGEYPIRRIKEHVCHELFGHVLFGEKNVKIVLQESGIYCLRNGFTLRGLEIPYECNPMWTEGCALLIQQEIMWKAEGTPSFLPQCSIAAYEMANFMQEIVGKKKLQDYLCDYQGDVVEEFNRKLFWILPNAFEYFESLAQLHQKAVLDNYVQTSYYLKQVKELKSIYHNKQPSRRK